MSRNISIPDPFNINAVNGLISNDSFLKLYQTVNTSFSLLNSILSVDLIDKLYSQLRYPAYINSYHHLVGQPRFISPSEPFGVQFNNYSETISIVSNKNEYSLSLIADISFSVNIVTQSGAVVNNRVLNLTDLTSSDKYYLDNKTIYFYDSSSYGSSFTVTYTGIYPGFGNLTDLRMNLVPDPIVAINNNSDKIQITKTVLPNSEYEYIFSIPLISQNYNGIIFPQPINNSSPAIYNDYIDNSNITFWRYDPNTSHISEIPSRDINLLNNNEFIFRSKFNLDENNDIVFVSMSNISISEMIQNLYLELKEHKHDNLSFSQKINHQDLGDLYKTSYNINTNTNQSFIKSVVEGNEHPQYFHRFGFTNSLDNSNKNNAILGDIVLSTVTGKLNSVTNPKESSFGLYFGSYLSPVVSMFYSAIEDSLVVNASSIANGLKIEGQNLSTSKHLSLNNSYFNSTSLASYIYTESGLSIFGDHTGLLQDVRLRNLYPKTIFILNQENSQIVFQNTTDSLKLYSDTDGHAVFSPNINSTANFINKVIYDNGVHLVVNDTLIANKAEVDYLKVKKELDMEDSTLFFYNTDKNESYTFESYGNKDTLGEGSNLSIKSNLNLFTETGYAAQSFNIYKTPSIGITPLELYTKLFHSSKDGLATNTLDNNLYLQTLAKGIYFLAGFGSGTISDYTIAPRIDLFAKEGNFKLVDVLRSVGNEKNGIEFDDTKANIFVTGTDLSCPAGTMIFEAPNGAVFVEDVSDLQTINWEFAPYADVTLNNLTVKGKIDVALTSTLNGDFSITGNLTTGNIDSDNIVSESVVSKSISTNDFEVSNTIKSSNIENKSSIITKDLDTENLTSTGYSELNKLVVEDTSTFIGEGRFNSPVIFDQTLTANDIKSQSLDSVTATVSSELKSLSLFSGVVGNFEYSLTANSSEFENTTVNDFFIANGDSTFNSQTNFNAVAIFNGDVNLRSNTTISGNLDVSANTNFNSRPNFNQGIIAFSNSEMDSLYIRNRLDIENSLNVGDTFTVSSNAVIADSSSFTVNVPTNLNNTLLVSGNTTLSNTTVNGRLDVKGIIDLQGNQIISGSLEVQQNIDAENIRTRNLEVEDSALVRKTLTVGDNIGSGSLNVRVKSFFNDDIVINSGGINQTNSSAKNNFNAETTFTNDVDAEYIKADEVESNTVIVKGTSSSSPGSLQVTGSLELSYPIIAPTINIPGVTNPNITFTVLEVTGASIFNGSITVNEGDFRIVKGDFELSDGDMTANKFFTKKTNTWDDLGNTGLDTRGEVTCGRINQIKIEGNPNGGEYSNRFENGTIFDDNVVFNSDLLINSNVVNRVNNIVVGAGTYLRFIKSPTSQSPVGVTEYSVTIGNNEATFGKFEDTGVVGNINNTVKSNSYKIETGQLSLIDIWGVNYIDTLSLLLPITSDINILDRYSGSQYLQVKTGAHFEGPVIFSGPVAFKDDVAGTIGGGSSSSGGTAVYA